MEKITVLLLIAALAGSEASSLFRASKGACPVVTTKPNFQIDRYLGNWYEIQKLSNNFQAGMECNMATYALTGPTSISVFNSGMYEDGSPTNITGSAQQDLPDEPGHLTLQFFGRPAGNYLVLETDYDSFTTVYSCGNLGIFKIEFAWLMSREKTMSPETLQLGLSIFTNYGIDVNQFTVTQHNGNCIYFDEPKKQ